MKKSRHIFIILLLALFSAAASFSLSASGSVRIKLQPSNPGVGDMAYLKIICINVNGKPSQPASVPGFSVKYFTLTKMKMKSVSDGHNVSTVQENEYSVTLRAEKEGSYTFGPIKVGNARSNTISYRIGPKSSHQKAPSSSAPANPYMPTHQPVLSKAGGNDLFLRAEVSTTTPYEQQPVVYSVKLYTSYEGTLPLGSPSAPSFENCTSEVSNVVDHNMNIETYNGRQYRTAVIMRYILFPSHSGKAVIKGNTVSFSVKQLMEYDDGSSQMIPIYQRGQVDAEVPTVTLDVRPLPAADDGAHINGVGRFDVKTTIPKTKASVNQIVNVKYTVSGVGNLNFLTLPDIASALPPELKFVKSESKMQKEITNTDMTGNVEFTVSLIPTKEGRVELPPLSFVFFNPADGKFYTKKATGCTFEVGKSTVSSDSNERLMFNSKLQNVGTLSKSPRFAIDSFGYYLIYLIPAVLLLLVIVVYRRHVRISSDIVGMRRRKAGKMARSRLKQSARFMRRGNRQEFYAETLKALWGYMAQKLNMPVSELSRDNVSERLLGFGASQELVSKVIDVIDQCEFARYASGASVDMKKVYDEASDCIEALEKVIPASAKASQIPEKATDNNSPS